MTEKRLLVVGSNGLGKSNLLEAVELLGSLRSHRSSTDKDLIKWDEQIALIEAITDETDKLGLELSRKGGRRAYKNEKLLTRQLDLIGPMRCVGFSALDLPLVRGEPSLRRTWLDRVVLQLEPVYSDLISRSLRLLRQRNQLLRNWRNVSSSEIDALLDTFDVQMALISTRIHRRRKRALLRLKPLASLWQQRLSNGKENLMISYLPGSVLDEDEDEDELKWSTSIQEQLLCQRPIEKKIGSCKVGPHRDEIEFLINGVSGRRFGSAGQQRTIVLALKLAELELLSEVYGDHPILLLDDVLAELDPSRQLLLLEAVGKNHQCLISATHLEAFEGDWKVDSQILRLENQ